MEKTIKIISDSSCDLPKELIKQQGIDIIPVPITDGVNNYQDSVNISADEVYENMKKGVIYKTSQVPLKDYIEKYTYYAQNDIPALSLVMSSGLSSSHSTSAMALETVKETYKDAKILTVDSKLCSLAHGYASYLMSISAQKGHGFDDLSELLKFLQDNIVSTATVDDLKYLARGGRLSNVTALIANTLNIKPFLHADDGSLHLFDKVRGLKKMYKRYIEVIKERNESTDFSKSTILIEKSDDDEMMLSLRDMIKEEFNLSDENFILGQIGPTIGAHIGPGSMCMFFLKNPLPDKFF